MFNGATSGMPIAYFQKDFPKEQDQFNGLVNNYNRLLNRIKAAGLTSFVRAAFWHQGEGDCGWGDDGTTIPHPTMQEYVNLFKTLKDNWFADYPNMQKVHPFQLGALCGEAWIWEAHRQLEIQIPNVQVMSASNCDHSDGCHYNYVAGYEIFGLNMYRLIAHDFYGSNDTASITPPSLTYVQRSGTKELTLVMKKVNDPLTWKEGSQKSFTLYGASGKLTTKVLSGGVSGNKLIITLDGNSSDVTAISFLGKSFPSSVPEAGYFADPLVYNANNIGALYFDQFPVGDATGVKPASAARSPRNFALSRVVMTGARGMGVAGMIQSSRDRSLVGPDGRVRQACFDRNGNRISDLAGASGVYFMTNRR